VKPPNSRDQKTSALERGPDLEDTNPFVGEDETVCDLAPPGSPAADSSEAATMFNVASPESLAEDSSEAATMFNVAPPESLAQDSSEAATMFNVAPPESLAADSSEDATVFNVAPPLSPAEDSDEAATMFDVAPPGSPATAPAQSGGSAPSGRVEPQAPAASGPQIGEPMTIREQMRRAREAVTAPREEAMEWQSAVNVPAGGLMDEPLPQWATGSNAGADGEEDPTVLGEAPKLPAFKAPAKPAEEASGRGSAPRQNGRLAARTQGRLETLGEAPPDEATVSNSPPVANGRKAAAATATVPVAHGGGESAEATVMLDAPQAPGAGARSAPPAAQTADETVLLDEAPRTTSAAGRRGAPSPAAARSAASADEDDEETAVSGGPQSARASGAGGRRRTPAASTERGESSSANRAGAFSRSQESEAPPVKTAEIPQADPIRRRNLKIAGGVIAGFFALLLIYQVAFSVEKPTALDLTVLYPYGASGAVGRRGERAPPVNHVRFEYLGRKACSSKPDADTCLLYEYSDSKGFRGTMLLRVGDDGMWERASDEGMPFLPARK
jgi:hypothetical protein